jgi:hypothetical protein
VSSSFNRRNRWTPLLLDSSSENRRQKEFDNCRGIGEVVGDQLVTQEGGELFVLLQKRVFEVGAEDVMAVLNAIDDGGQLAAHCAVQARSQWPLSVSRVNRLC